MNKWTPIEEKKLIKYRDEGKSLLDIAQALGRTPVAVERKLDRLGRIAPKRKPLVDATTPLDQDIKIKTEQHWRRQYEELLRKYNKLGERVAAVDQLVSDIKEVAPKSYTSAPSICKLHRSGKSSPQSAVFVFSDTHVGKEVSPDQTLGFGCYNFMWFLARLRYCEEAIKSILEDHVTTSVDELVLPILGDMLDGALNHAAEASQSHTLFEQYFGAGHAIAQFIRNVATFVPRVRIYTAVGNHTRWQNQRKMPTDNRFSNLDQFLYAFIQALTRDIKNVEWHLNYQPFCLFEVQNFLFHGSHGDHLRGGDKALGIPNHAVGRSISATSQLFGKAGKRSPEYYLTGHLHRSIVLPHATGQFIVNGGFPGLDNYALMSNFSPVDPTQKFFMVHPKFGVTASYDLQMKFAREEQADAYVIPELTSREDVV